MNFVDLFCGCGGFSLGLRWAGFEELAAIDFNKHAIDVFMANFPNSINVINEDLRIYPPEKLMGVNEREMVDLIVGGPPCQGFSTVRQRDGSNSGDRIIADDRRDLYRELLKYVAYFHPKLFVMENVLGIKSAAGGHFFNKVQVEARQLGYRVFSQTINAWEYGVPQKRQRQLIFGTRLDLPIFIPSIYIQKTHSKNYEKGLEPIVTLGEAIGDLPPLSAGEGLELADYSEVLRKQQIEKYSGRYLFDVLEVDNSPKLTSHRARPHSLRDLRDFAKILEGETGSKALLRNVSLEAPYDRTKFKDRYTRQHRDHLCSTIVAHLSKDGLMFIHPTQDRSLTPREAARIQSFPDTFSFPVSRTQQFTLIGNAVPPLLAKAVGLGISAWLEHIQKIKFDQGSQPKDITQATQWMENLIRNYRNGNLASAPNDVLLKGWKGICYLYYDLHPDSIVENGKTIVNETSSRASPYDSPESKTSWPIYEQSGWPVRLVPYAREARKRYVNNEINYEDYYCDSVMIRGYLRVREGENGATENN